uniref:Integrase catalytic domain-containing protein n=1 Tax=Meloidogyne javanica TaxID=6303 RepID=A0A915N9Z1_MELJA
MPVARRTIPSLELHATMLGCKYASFVRKQLDKEVPIEKVQIWTDSADVLDFLLSEKRLDRFDFDPDKPVTEKEPHPIYEMSSALSSQEEVKDGADLTRFSNWNRLINSIAYAKRFLSKSCPAKREEVRVKTQGLDGNKAIQEMCREERAQKRDSINLMQSKRIQDFFLLHQIQWMFNTPLAPWRGGFYERLIGSVKHHLYRVIGKKKIPFEELMTLLIEVERILNERPLTYVTSREVVEPVRPIDILDCSAGNPFDINLTPTSDEDEAFEPKESSTTTLLRAHQKALLKSHTFWREWKNTYLVNLRERWHSDKKIGQKFPQVDQVVLVKDERDKCPRSLWKLGRVERVISDRTVIVKIGEKSLERPTNLLYPLETEEKPNEEKPSEDEKSGELVKMQWFLVGRMSKLDIF